MKAATVAAKVLAVAATALAAGSLLVGGLLAAPQESGTVDVHGYRAVRRGTLAAGAAGAVSYTHLDVYKRQA